MSNNGMSESLLDLPIPETNVPILAPTKPMGTTTVKTEKMESVQEKINKFADWILYYVPEPIK
jgi:hypothetical protein